MKNKLLLLSILSLCIHTTWSQIPQTISYQGVLTDTSGRIVPDGNYFLTFKMYEDSSGGPPLCTGTHSTVSIPNGVFDVILGINNVLSLSFENQYCL